MQATIVTGATVVPAPAAAATPKGRIILVHGTCHGGWCWYKVATLLRAAGHRVDAPDLVASGADARRPADAPTFEEYTRPLQDILRALPEGERAVLVGHSFGGMGVALAAEALPEKVAAAVFVAAFMPDCTNRRSYVLEKSALYAAELQRQPPFSEDRYGAVSRVYVVVRQDLAIAEELQRWMVANFPVTEVREMAGADHMAMLSAPEELAGHLADIANTYH